MDLERFNKLTKREDMPSQARLTWQLFLEICELYLAKWKIEHPIIVELGVRKNQQKKFYEEFLGAEHIGVDISNYKGEPDVLGDTHAPQTLEKLHKVLRGREIDILFIDASHTYESVRKDYEMYAPFCTGIIAFDDIHLSRHRLRNRFNHGVFKFWDELKTSEEYKDILFISTHQRKETDGIGLIKNK